MSGTTIPLLRRQDFICGDWPRYSVIGPRGAVNLTFYELFGKWIGADFGIHSAAPLYAGCHSEDRCELLGEVRCHYDGSGLRAGQYVHLHVAGNTDAIYEVLERDYLERFHGGEA